MNRKAILIFLSVLFLLMQAISIFYVGSYVWDDGAITLAFSKTFASSGKIALTPVSEIVEGTPVSCLCSFAPRFMRCSGLILKDVPLSRRCMYCMPARIGRDVATLSPILMTRHA